MGCIVRPHAPSLTGRVIAGRYHVGFPQHPGRPDGPLQARDLAFDRPVTLRLLRSAGARSATARIQVDRAQRALALESPYLASVRDVGFLSDAIAYVVADWVEGSTLSALAERGEIPSAGESVRFIRQACAALHEAHGLGLVHGAVRPENLAVAGGPRRRSIRVLGIGAPDWRTAGETEALRYLAPEQRDGLEPDRRADVWGLGAVLLDLLIRGGATDGALERVIQCCLAKHPMHRPLTAAALSSSLAPFDGAAPRRRWWCACERPPAPLTQRGD